MGSALLTESALSFLGLGVQPPAASWGNMLSGAQSSLFSAPWLAVFPGAMILLAVVSINLLGDALRDLQKYVQQESYNNPNGGVNEFGPAIQFDTKGVEFGPWIRRFIAQVKRNWIVPNSALAMRGRVIIQFNVHKDGSITDLSVVRPSEIDSFNRSALNALMMSNPTTPLPPEYPDDRAFFTVTFFFNESPAQQ